MNIKSKLKYIWLTIAVSALVSTLSQWFGFESENLQNAILAFNGLMFILSVPCSLFFVPVAFAANYYLEINCFSTGGIYLNTFFLFVLGLTQWFWVNNFWYPTESPFQKFELLKD